MEASDEVQTDDIVGPFSGDQFRQLFLSTFSQLLCYEIAV